ncbi:DNA-binding PadR family transcriptional regulator [Catenulispora sp. EB89]|uniref:PadR family transcriptional regulator n=1 Tax=Catenulispora sp. EB89 TaxID=3156257 RepID=UPI0035194231
MYGNEYRGRGGRGRGEGRERFERPDRGFGGPGGPGGWGRRGESRSRWDDLGELRGGGGRGGRARRGDVRAAVLALLAERPMHGYEMIQELETRTGGLWRPSPGALYPALQLLEDEGKVTADASSGKRLLELTEAGRAAVAEAPDNRPWENFGTGVPEVHMALRDGVHQLGTAARQVAQVGTEEQKTKALAILGEARKALYKLLAEDV